MSKYQEALDKVRENLRELAGAIYYGSSDLAILQELVDKEKSMKPAEVWEHANPSEALKQLKDISYVIMEAYSDHEPLNENQRDSKQCFMDYIKNIKQTLLKAQEQEKENELLREIIKSLFDKGCPLHQYDDIDFGLIIEVDNEFSIMHLGEFKGIDLDKKLNEVLCDE